MDNLFIKYKVISVQYALTIILIFKLIWKYRDSSAGKIEILTQHYFLWCGLLQTKVYLKVRNINSSLRCRISLKDLNFDLIFFQYLLIAKFSNNLPKIRQLVFSTQFCSARN